MVRILVLSTLVSLFTVGVFAQNSTRRPNLSERGEKAYEMLRNTVVFEDAVVGYGGVLSSKARSFEILVNEQDADQAFKSLLANAPIAGKLYGLAGLFYTDRSSFESEVKRWRRSNETVRMHSGCEVFEEQVAQIIESDAPNVAIIGPGETLEQYLAGNGSPAVVTTLILQTVATRLRSGTLLN